MQEFDKADELYQAGMKVDPQNANLLVHRGLVALQAKGDISKAVELITRGLDIDEKCEFAYETLGTIEVRDKNQQYNLLNIILKPLMFRFSAAT